MTTDYQKQATDFLTAHNLDFRAVLVGNDCPPFCEDARNEKEMDKLDTYPRRSHIHGKHYRCTISGKERGHVSFDFWNSYADEEQNHVLSHRFSPSIPDSLHAKYKGKPRATVTAYDILACIQKNDPGSFEDFCSEFGYDEDSRRAFHVYEAVTREWKKVRKFFTAEEIEQLQEIN